MDGLARLETRGFPSSGKRPMKGGEMVSDEVARTEREPGGGRTGWLLAVVVFGAVLVLYGAIAYAVFRLIALVV